MPTRHDLQPLGAHGHEDGTPTPAPTAHTPEPWRTEDLSRRQSAIMSPGNPYVLAMTYGDDRNENAQANAARIVAAVNACAGIADPAAAIAAARAVLKDLVQSYGESAFGAWRALELLGEK